ncbi:MAG: hypothetical protein PF517_03135 [Salinivirgaceae bacterium]|nr:hypothetical protein [Salinivirgaceae bacterium]
MAENISIKDFSPHLFWDVDISKVDISKNRKWFITRVLEYGLFNDWLLLKQYYGIDQIAEISFTIRDLSKKSISFISLLSNIPKEKFSCYSTKQLTSNYWNS